MIILHLFILSLCFALRQFSEIEEIEKWSRQREVAVLGLLREKTPRRKLKLFEHLANMKEFQNSGLSFGVVISDDVWYEYDFPSKQDSAIVLYTNYNEIDGTWTAGGSTEIVYESEISNDSKGAMSQTGIWILSRAFPPVIDLQYLENGNANSKRRAKFIKTIDMPKILLMHDGLTIPNFFYEIRKGLKYRVQVLAIDISNNEDISVPERGWMLVSGSEPTDPEKVWGEYDGELKREDVNLWVKNDVLRTHFTESVRETKRVKAKTRKQRKKEAKKKEL